MYRHSITAPLAPFAPLPACPRPPRAPVTTLPFPSRAPNSPSNRPTPVFPPGLPVPRGVERHFVLPVSAFALPPPPQGGAVAVAVAVDSRGESPAGEATLAPPAPASSVGGRPLSVTPPTPVSREGKTEEEEGQQQQQQQQLQEGQEKGKQKEVVVVEEEEEELQGQEALLEGSTPLEPGSDLPVLAPVGAGRQFGLPLGLLGMARARLRGNGSGMQPLPPPVREAGPPWGVQPLPPPRRAHVEEQVQEEEQDAVPDEYQEGYYWDQRRAEAEEMVNRLVEEEEDEGEQSPPSQRPSTPLGPTPTIAEETWTRTRWGMPTSEARKVQARLRAAQRLAYGASDWSSMIGTVGSGSGSGS
jgi:hypothetical protein